MSITCIVDNPVSFSEISSNNRLITATALSDWEPQDSAELRLTKGAVIVVLEKDDSGWWEGQLNDVLGVFPGAYCETLDPSKLGPPATTSPSPSSSSGSLGGSFTSTNGPPASALSVAAASTTSSDDLATGSSSEDGGGGGTRERTDTWGTAQEPTPMTVAPVKTATKVSSTRGTNQSVIKTGSATDCTPNRF